MKRLFHFLMLLFGIFIFIFNANIERPVIILNFYAFIIFSFSIINLSKSKTNK